jgi:hypothetical protein
MAKRATSRSASSHRVRPFATPTNVTNALTFLTFFTPGNGNYSIVGTQTTSGTLMNLFCADSGSDPTAFPQVAVTEHGLSLGPSFEGGAFQTAFYDVPSLCNHANQQSTIVAYRPWRFYLQHSSSSSLAHRNSR